MAVKRMDFAVGSDSGAVSSSRGCSFALPLVGTQPSTVLTYRLTIGEDVGDVSSLPDF